MYLMRQIENAVKPQWDSLKQMERQLRPFRDCQPSMLRGWTDNNPSLWDISSDPDKPSLEDILVALCRTKKDWDKIAYLTFSKTAIYNAELTLTLTNGKTGDSKIDTSNTHYEIKELTAKRLCDLIYYIMQNNYETGYFKKTDFDKILYDGYTRSRIMNVATSGTTMIETSSVVKSSTASDNPKDKLPELTEKDKKLKIIPSSTS